MTIFLFLVSLLALIVGLVKPSIFQRIIKRVPTRKQVGVVLGTLTVILFFVIGGSSTENPTKVDSQNQAVPESATEAPSNSETQKTEEPTQTTPSPSQNPPAPSAVQPQSQASSEYYSIVSVTDGDTFKVSINGKTETVRAIGIDTPETVDPRKPVECFGKEASNKAKAMLTGKKVKLEADSTQGDRDKYSRLLRYAWLEDGTFFNKQMIVDGYASEYTYNTPYKYQAEFKQAQTEAKNAKRGLWADDACIQEETQPTPPPAVSPGPSGHTWYTSSHYSATYYYCDTDDGWKGLSPTYLKSFSSAEALLQAYPNRSLHEPCK